MQTRIKIDQVEPAGYKLFLDWKNLLSNHVKDETYARAAQLLDETYLAQVMLSIITINAWNRIGIATNLLPL
jgi:hypothetical protein